MRFSLLSALVLTTCFLTSAHADGKLVMANADSGSIQYKDKCSNGRNSDAAGRLAFVAKLRENPSSKLGKLLAGYAAPDTKVRIGDWTQTFNERNGCGSLHQTYSAFVFVEATMGNGHELAARALVTIGDDVDDDKRALTLRSILTLEQPAADPTNGGASTKKVLFESAVKPIGGIAVKGPFATTTVFEDGTWQRRETNPPSPPTTHGGALSRDQLATIEKQLASAPWTVSQAKIVCDAMATTEDVISIRGKVVITERMCGRDNLDPTSAKALAAIQQLLAGVK